MSNPWITAALLLVAGIACTPAIAQVTFSEPEVAYIAAMEKQASFARDAKICPTRANRKRQDADRAAYEQANPDYVAALALSNPRAEVRDLVASEQAATDKMFEQMQAMMAMMPREVLCKERPAEPATATFQKTVDATRDMLARRKLPVPELPLTTLDAADVSAIVTAVLQHPDVAMYLHPDAPGRVPVRVAVAAPYDRAPITLSLYGAPVKSTRTSDRDAVQLAIKPHGDQLQVEVDYQPEGIHGTVDFERTNGTWRVTDAKIYE